MGRRRPAPSLTPASPSRRPDRCDRRAGGSAWWRRAPRRNVPLLRLYDRSGKHSRACTARTRAADRLYVQHSGAYNLTSGRLPLGSWARLSLHVVTAGDGEHGRGLPERHARSTGHGGEPRHRAASTTRADRQRHRRSAVRRRRRRRHRGRDAPGLTPPPTRGAVASVGAGVGEASCPPRARTASRSRRVQRQLQDAERVVVAHLAVGLRVAERVVAAAAGADDELADAVRGSARPPASAARSARSVVVAGQDQVGAGVVERLPERLLPASLPCCRRS